MKAPSNKRIIIRNLVVFAPLIVLAVLEYKTGLYGLLALLSIRSVTLDLGLIAHLRACEESDEMAVDELQRHRHYSKDGSVEMPGGWG